MATDSTMAISLPSIAYEVNLSQFRILLNACRDAAIQGDSKVYWETSQILLYCMPLLHNTLTRSQQRMRSRDVQKGHKRTRDTNAAHESNEPLLPKRVTMVNSFVPPTVPNSTEDT